MVSRMTFISPDATGISRLSRPSSDVSWSSADRSGNIWVRCDFERRMSDRRVGSLYVNSLIWIVGEYLVRHCSRTISAEVSIVRNQNMLYPLGEQTSRQLVSILCRGIVCWKVNGCIRRLTSSLVPYKRGRLIRPSWGIITRCLPLIYRSIKAQPVDR